MTSPALTFHGRLPGVGIAPALPPAASPVRLDVAAFAGFAGRGPVDVPVALADPAAFTTIFGGDLVLAEDAGKPVYAQLPAAVRAFFDNGGKRCYAVRVAGPNRTTSRWQIPGMQVWDPVSGAVTPVEVEAAWPGRWAAGTQVTIAPIARPLTRAAAYQRAGAGPGQLLLPPVAAASVQPGDLLTLDDHLFVRAVAVDGGVVSTGTELPYGLSGPDPGALAGLPSVFPVDVVTLLRMDLVVQRLEDGQLHLVERFDDLAYASFGEVLQPAGDPEPDLDRSLNLRAVAGGPAGLVVPTGPAAAGPPLVEGDDDLDTYDPWAVFVDDRLGHDTVLSLMADADALTSLAAVPARLRGIHALLPIEDVAMVACPDLTQRGWSPVPPPAADPPPDPPEPPLGPDWSDFRCCAVAETPAPPPPAPEPIVTPPVAGVQLDPVAAYDDGPLLAVQSALVTMCAARADLVALLSVPRHYDRRDVEDWHRALVASAPDLLSFAAYWHPWLTLPDPLRDVPPDGAVAGMIAARELSRGVWVAPAAVPLLGPIDVGPRLVGDDPVRLFDAHANVVVQRPGSFAPIAAHTLADEPLLQLSVRRTLILLRKIALQAGQRYTFEINNERFRQLVQRRFERILAALTAQGAFHAYEVGTAADDGSLVVSLRVAPTSPVEFVTVTLVRSGEGLLDVWED
ncbi:hypothetical protein [Micromonospora sp. NPDC005806]|uniref:hypothetical protein n=1 Tax=Micromonospora sp. NPDC005806 TaxID=3364234 RepID=UPI0036923FA3